MIKDKIGSLLFIFVIFLIPKALAEKKVSDLMSNRSTSIPSIPAGREMPDISDSSAKMGLYSDWERPRDISKNRYFLLGDKIVNPACISLFSPGFKDDAYIRSIDLTSCQAIEEYRQVRIRNFAFSPRKLNTNVEYNYNDKDFKDGFFGYQYAGQSAGNITVLITYNNGGGTGYIESVLLFKITQRDHHTILTRIGGILGGDRCVGGITSTSIKDNILTVETYEGKSAPDCNYTKQTQYDLSKSLPDIQ